MPDMLSVPTAPPAPPGPPDSASAPPGRETEGPPFAKVLEDPNVGILILSADDMTSLSNTMRRRLETTPRPVVIAVGKREEEDLRAKIKRAIGVDLYK